MVDYETGSQIAISEFSWVDVGHYELRVVRDVACLGRRCYENEVSGLWLLPPVPLKNAHQVQIDADLQGHLSLTEPALPLDDLQRELFVPARAAPSIGHGRKVN